MIADLRGDKAEAAARDIEGAWGTACDVGNEAQVQATMDETLKRFGQVDIIVNNAGVMVFKHLEEHTEEDWLWVIRVNLMGAFFFTKQAFLHMRPGGSIVNVSSVHAEATTPLVCSYAAAKAGLLSLTRSSSLEGKAKGIRVNAVVPGAVDTPMLWDNPNIKSGQEQLEKSDVGKAENVAAAIAFLASNDAEFVEGAVLRVDGGRLNRL